MKRILALILITATLISVLGCYVYAGVDYIKPNPGVKLSISSPKIDGYITQTEGWSDACYLNEDTLGYANKDVPLSIWGEVNFAMDTQGMYFAADILDGAALYDPEYNGEIISNSFVASTTEAEEFGYNGDVFCFMIDPLCGMEESGFTGELDYALCYYVTLFEDGRTGIENAYTVSSVSENSEAVAVRTEDGWRFEAFIPWSVILEDLDAHTFGEVNFITPQMILKSNSLHKMGVMYVDRCFTDKGEIETLNRYSTVPEDLVDPEKGMLSNGYSVASLGINVTIGSSCGKSGHSWSDWIRVVEPTYIEKGKEISLCRRCGDTMYRDVAVLEYKFQFSDLNFGAWYYDGALYCIKHGYMNGVSGTQFSPNTMLTREQCVMILANLFNIDTSKYKYEDSGFKDVPTGKWYSGAVAWAVECGYIKGMSEDTFGTGQYIKRDAFARILYAAAKRMGMPMNGRADLSNYVDHADVPSWAQEEIAWAVVNGIIVSTKDDVLMLSPRDEVKRAQCATMLWQLGELYDRYVENGIIEDNWRR